MAEFAAASGSGRVDISEWSFYGREEDKPTPFLIGPIVGAVTTTDARVLVEMDDTQEVTMEAFVEGESVCTVTQEVMGKTPTAFKISDLKAKKRVRVVVTAGDQTREACFTCTGNKRAWKIAVVSCNCHTHSEKLGLWNRLSRVMDEVDCVLHLGDQIYGDSDFVARESGEHFESAWHASLTILTPLPRNEWEEHTEEILECYRKTYRTTWNIPHVAKVLASAANYMICDDHEFTDDLGDEPEHSNPATVEFFVARLAYRVYNEYQRQLLEDVDVTDDTIKPFYSVKLSPRVGFFMTDNRIERSLHRDQATRAEWEDRAFLGPSQWESLTEAFETQFANCDLVLLGTPTPLVFLSDRATGLAQMKIDDARGTWGHKDFKSEQAAMTKMLTDWQNAKSNRVVVTLGGDVHMGGFTDSWHNGSDIPLHQLTASAVGNIPEGNIDAAKELIIRGAMHADEKLFSFKVKHYRWIYGPNYGMVDAHLTNHGHNRPHTTLTLVPHKGSPKIRNLALGDSSIKVEHEDQSQASKRAHSSARIMGQAP